MRTDSENRFRLAFWPALALAALLLVARAGPVPLIDPDEARFARTSQEMLRAGELLVPMFEGQPRLVKPPLMHWIQLSLFRWFGVSEGVARVHAILASLASVALVGWLVRRRFGHEGAFWATLTMATLPLVAVLGRIGTLDALLALHVLAVVAVDMTEERARGQGHIRGLAVGALLGLAFLVKGPVGVVLPLLMMLAGRTATGRDVVPRPAAALNAVAGWCVVVLPWGLAFIHRVGGATVGKTVQVEALERYFAGTTHVEPFWFYIPVMLAIWFPWITPAFFGLMRAVRHRRDPAARTAVYAAAALVAGLVFFSIGRSKLPSYILPLSPMIAVLATWELGQQIRAPRKRNLGSSLLTATTGAFAVGFATAGAGQLEGVPRTVALVGAGIYGLGTLAAMPALIRRKPRTVYGCAAASSAAFLLVALTLLAPDLANSRSSAGLIRQVPELSSHRPLIVVDMEVPSLTYYLDRVPEVVDMAHFEGRLAENDDPLIVFADVDLDRVSEETMQGLVRVGQHAKFVIFEKRDSPVPDDPEPAPAS